MLRQRTIREKVGCEGVGLHSGQQIKLELLPSPEDSGITFTRTDLPRHPEIRPCIEHLKDTTLATTLGVEHQGVSVRVATVEHLLSALMGLGIDNARVLVDGPEIPILDGSAGPFVDMLRQAGVEWQRRPKRFMVIKKEVKVRDGNKMARIAPGAGLRITCSLDFDHPLISVAPFRFDFSERSFEREVARARTFGFIEDVEALRQRGLARGGSLDNAIVIDSYRVLNPEGLRFPDEFVRHKLLDAMGDIALFGMPVVGRFSSHRGGHEVNCRLVRTVLADAKAYEIVQHSDVAAGREDVRAFELFDAVESIA